MPVEHGTKKGRFVEPVVRFLKFVDSTSFNFNWLFWWLFLCFEGSHNQFAKNSKKHIVKGCKKTSLDSQFSGYLDIDIEWSRIN